MRYTKKFALALLACAAITNPIVLAQTPTVKEHPVRVANFTEEFNDPDDITAKALAKVERIPLVEAKQRLRLMNEAAVLVHKLRNRYPDNFSGALAVNKAPFHINVYFTGAEPVKIRPQVIELGVSTELLSVLKVGKSTVSEKGARSKARALLGQLRSRGIEGTVAWSSLGDSYKLLVKNTAEARTAQRMGFVPSGKNITVEAFSGITLAADLIGGEVYDMEPWGDLNHACTLGFNVLKRGTSEYGVSTAAHCSNKGRYYREATQPSNYDLAFVQEWNTNGVDIQWSRVNAGPAYTIVPKFWNGQTIATVTGSQSDYPGMFACKFGRKTKQTCGYVDPYQRTSVDEKTGHVYGDFPRINKNLVYDHMVDYGDSGGPVFAGTLAVGSVHGFDAERNIYFTPLRTMFSNNLPIGVTCSC